jgi:hypothetical protein
VKAAFHVAAIGLVLLLAGTGAEGATVLVEAEGFKDHGGWVVDQQSMDVMGSPYLLAHGLGVPVADATTTVAFPAPGEYRVWVRTKNWVARWKAPGAPGKFQLLVNGKPLAETFGVRGEDWSWHDGGTVRIEGKEAGLALHDLTGFAGRCDAVLLSSEKDFAPPQDAKQLAALRAKLLGLPDRPQEAGPFDLVVTGGGVAGCCSAVCAARLGLKVALIQDRPVLGGNSSSEVRVWIQGQIKQRPYPVIGEIVGEMLTRPKRCPDKAEAYGDDLKMKVVAAEKDLALFLWEHVDQVEMEGKRIKAVVATNVLTGRRTRFAGRWFVDATGDATVGFLAGADHEVEATGHLGTSNLWYTEDTGQRAAFPRCPWALDLRDKPFPSKLEELGHWYWESGFDIDTVREAEAIRDHNLRAMFGAWDCLKNVKQLYPQHRLAWAAYVSGKRESRRLLGDVVLTQQDVVGSKEFPDGCVSATWSIDLHYPDPKYAAASPGNEFISVAKFTPFKKPYPAPYRCLYSRNVPNLWMAGRCISVTHEALGTVRVMGTGGLMGECVGRAAAVCKRHGADPRDVYRSHLPEFLELLKRPTRKAVPGGGPLPPELAGAVGANAAREARAASSGNLSADGHPPEAACDGLADLDDNAGRWLSHARTPNWIELSWDRPRTLAAARIVSGYHNGGGVGDPVADFVLQRHDGQSWQDIPGTRVEGNTRTDWACRFPPVRAARVRLLVTKTTKDISRIWEIELYEPN